MFVSKLQKHGISDDFDLLYRINLGESLLVDDSCKKALEEKTTGKSNCNSLRMSRDLYRHYKTANTSGQLLQLKEMHDL